MRNWTMPKVSAIFVMRDPKTGKLERITDVDKIDKALKNRLLHAGAAILPTMPSHDHREDARC